MERYETLFAQLKARREGAFVPFVTLGDPNPEQSLKIIDTLIEAGADALELGIPFSDPLADGPTIQDATLRAFCRRGDPRAVLRNADGDSPETPYHSYRPADVRQRCSAPASMNSTPRANARASIPCWLPMFPWKSPRRSAVPRCATISRRFSSARPMPMTICCAR